MAARTSRIRLATGICLVPEHNPLVLAKVIASLDYLSGGRFALGVGIGWSSEEFAALGLPFERRAQRTREYIDVMRKLWSEEKTSFSGEFVNFKEARMFPKPPQGAACRSSLAARADRRCAASPITARLVRLQSQSRTGRGQNRAPEGTDGERKRDLREVELIVSPYLQNVTREDLTGYREAGVSEVVMLCPPPENDAELTPILEKMARDWVEPRRNCAERRRVGGSHGATHDFSSKLIGLFCIAFSLSMIAHRQATVDLMTTLVHDPPLVLLMGMIGLAVGLAMVLGHNIWSGGALTVVVTVVGWVILIRGLLLLFLPPATFVEIFASFHFDQFFLLYLAIPLALGVYLTWAASDQPALRGSTSRISR